MPLTINPKKISYFSIYLSIAIALSAIEYMFFPNLPVPGIKIGLANLVVLLMLGNYNSWEIGLMVLLRVFISSVIIGTLMTPAFYFSLGGGIMSYIFIIIVYKAFYGKVSLVGIGVIGAAAHNIGQIAVAYFLIQQMAVIAYLPVLILSAIPFGILTGAAAKITLSKMTYVKQPFLNQN